MTKIDSLYQLIKQKSQEKGRPLKIIADWDECLFSFRPTAIHRLGIKKPFKEFFADYWERTTVTSQEGDSANKIFTYDAPEGEEKIAYEKWKKLTLERKANHGKNSASYDSTVVQGDSPPLSLSEELLKCLKENLIDKLEIITSTAASKKGKPSKAVEAKKSRYSKTFANFPQCNLSIMEIQRVNNKNNPHRWEWIKTYHPDFDIFIDDDKSWIKSVREHFGSEKIHIINDYKTNRELKGDNIYHVKTTVSDLKDSDFAIAALEIKTKQLEQKLATTKHQRERERERAVYWMVGSGLVILVLAILLVMAWRKKKKKLY